jgi:hypothetical protein
VPEEALLKMKDKLITLLVRNGEQPFLAGLSKELTKRAALLFAEILQKAIPNTDSLERLFAGEITLNALPGAEEPIRRAAGLIAENLRDGVKHAAFATDPILMLERADDKTSKNGAQLLP